MRILNTEMVTDGDMSDDITSIGINMRSFCIGSIQAVFTGAPVGDFKLQISSDRVPIAWGDDPGANVVTWTDYSDTAYSITEAGDYMWNIVSDGAGYNWIRLVYTDTGGTGSLNVNISAKGV